MVLCCGNPPNLGSYFRPPQPCKLAYSRLDGFFQDACTSNSMNEGKTRSTSHAGRAAVNSFWCPPPPRGQAQRLYGLHKPAGRTPKEAGIVIATPPLRTVAKRCHSIAGTQLAIHSFLHYFPRTSYWGAHSYYPRGLIMGHNHMAGRGIMAIMPAPKAAGGARGRAF